MQITFNFVPYMMFFLSLNFVSGLDFGLSL